MHAAIGRLYYLCGCCTLTICAERPHRLDQEERVGVCLWSRPKVQEDANKNYVTRLALYCM